MKWRAHFLKALIGYKNDLKIIKQLNNKEILVIKLFRLNYLKNK